MSDTPETDAYYAKNGIASAADIHWMIFADKLERERDEAVEILTDCLAEWGCECPYCDRDFGKEFNEHHDDCKAARFLLTTKGRARA